jgi:DNA-binding transcriptional LysR family regulator
MAGTSPAMTKQRIFFKLLDRWRVMESLSLAWSISSAYVQDDATGSLGAMNLRHMEVFHAIMRTGSVTGAARSLNVTQPAVSAVLKHCESQLKMKLFTRVSGRLQPTAEARAIFPEIAAIFGRVEAVNSLTQDLVGGRLGTLSIAASFPIANGYLAKAVAVHRRAAQGAGRAAVADLAAGARPRRQSRGRIGNRL